VPHLIPKKGEINHLAFTESMYKGLNPNATYKMTKTMPSGDQICEGKTTF
jgi:hypothetical protein